MSNWRKNIYDVINTDNDGIASRLYSAAMLVFIVMSLIPLAFREETKVFTVFDKVSVSVFVVDYVLRWLTADYAMPEKKRWQAFLVYPFTPFAIIDLLSILPSFITVAHRAFKLLRITRLMKILRVVRLIRYSRNMQILIRVLRKERHILMTVFMIAVAYIFVTALIMFNMEDSAMFEDFFDALYWATTTLTTVGYGDIYPMSDIGRVISMFSAVFGVAVIALPSGVITASYMDELRESKEAKESKEKKKKEEE